MLSFDALFPLWPELGLDFDERVANEIRLEARKAVSNLKLDQERVSNLEITEKGLQDAFKNFLLAIKSKFGDEVTKNLEVQFLRLSNANYDSAASDWNIAIIRLMRNINKSEECAQIFFRVINDSFLRVSQLRSACDHLLWSDWDKKLKSWMPGYATPFDYALEIFSLRLLNKIHNEFLIKDPKCKKWLEKKFYELQGFSPPPFPD
jgi:hypothetical protein